MECRPGCGACCIAPSISSPIPGLPEGKPAGVRCVQLDENNLCRLFGQEERPRICRNFPASHECGEERREALVRLEELEAATR
ncbi:MAG: YkgJ family cysteine cluster protein [Pseudomonadota bacterium]